MAKETKRWGKGFAMRKKGGFREESPRRKETRHRGRWLAPFLLLGAFFFQACTAVPLSENASNTGSYREIVLLHTNDVHGNIRPLKAVWVDTAHPPLIGGSASLAGFVRTWRDSDARRPDLAVRLLDAGDIYQGTPEGNESKGRLMVEVMNRIGYDYAAVGNHDLDNGVENLKTLVQSAKFPWMAENLRDAGTGARLAFLSGPHIEKILGIDVGFFGITTEDMAKVTLLDTSIAFVEPELEAAVRTARELRAKGAEYVVMISHSGVSHDSVLASLLGMERDPATGRPLVDLIVGGHSHTRLEKPLEIKGVRVVQTGAKGTAVGEIHLRWDVVKGRKVGFEYRLVDLYNDSFPPDPEMKRFLAPILARFDSEMGVVVGRARDVIERSFAHGSSPLGNLITDLMRKASGAEIAFQNKGGIRAEIPAGEVRRRDLYAVSPFGNTVVLFKMPGSLVRRIVAKSLDGGYTPLEISGIIVYYDSSRPAWDRLVNVFVGKEPLDDDRIYTVATNSFLAGGGDAYTEFTEAGPGRDLGKSLREIEEEFFRSRKEPVEPEREKRWRDINEFSGGEGEEGP